MAKYNLEIDGVSIEAVFNKLGGVEGAKRFLRGELVLVEKVQNFLTATQKLTVNYDRTIADLFTAGKYDRKNGDITDKNFSSSENGEKKVEFGMYHFNKDNMGSENIIATMKLDGFRPATMKELLSYGEKNPKEQRRYTILALGSVAEIDGRQRVGYLIGDDHGRNAGLHLFDFGWHSGYHFLAVRIDQV